MPRGHRDILPGFVLNPHRRMTYESGMSNLWIVAAIIIGLRVALCLWLAEVRARYSAPSIVCRYFSHLRFFFFFNSIQALNQSSTLQFVFSFFLTIEFSRVNPSNFKSMKILPRFLEANFFYLYDFSYNFLTCVSPFPPYPFSRGFDLDFSRFRRNGWVLMVTATALYFSWKRLETLRPLCFETRIALPPLRRELFKVEEYSCSVFVPS